MVVEFDPARLAEPVVEEDLYAAGELFPHVYAAIPTALATAVHPLPRGSEGRFDFPATSRSCSVPASAPRTADRRVATRPVSAAAGLAR